VPFVALLRREFIPYKNGATVSISQRLFSGTSEGRTRGELSNPVYLEKPIKQRWSSAL